MKLFVFALAITAAFAINAPSADYLPPVAAGSAPSTEYLPPAATEVKSVAVPAPEAHEVAESVPQGSIAADGYRYKTVRRLKYRHRRDASPVNTEYLPPVSAATPSQDYLPPAASEQSSFVVDAPQVDSQASATSSQGSLASDGYRYKTVRRLKYRHRRDVSHLNTEYLPPVAASEHQEYSVAASAPAPQVSFASAPAPQVSVAPAPVEQVASASVSQGSLADDGYRYKTVRRLKYRHRRDVSHLNTEYLPPVAASEHQEYSVAASAPAPQVSFASAPAPQVSVAPAPAPVEQVASASVSQGSLADDGYRYKTVRRLKYRHRRDVSHLNTEYLPPVAASEHQEYSVAASAPAPQVAFAPAPAPQASFASAPAPAAIDYQTSSSFQTESFAPVPVADNVAAPSVPQGSLADDGYRYKTVRRLRYRHRH